MNVDSTVTGRSPKNRMNSTYIRENGNITDQYISHL
jgi:hypothetical protein